ncbi:DUF3068 domain-containing protein [Blastococcus sp. CT_GayMR16]|uniref:DUF3068 domain-containing protein n=1 Tax=Blastococcus sp. CT_GayMR16 TaxID=2559607 RepID=UPI0010749059|nr:DUF3068 domain-containing protein [Blastococcus sp. CT_GayMR16]TFV82846.1 DUF3068 domain-containing protein [Blastococcus sp. CT_GayMR16]
MRRRAIGLGLLGVGAFLLAAALAVRVFLVPVMVRLPLDQTGSTTVSDENATYFDMKELEQKSGFVEANVQVEGDPEAEDADSDVAVWLSGTAITDEDGELVTPTTESTICLDRHSAESVPCDAAQINDEPTDIEGLTVTFPLGTEARDYEVWNSNIGAAVPARYVGEEEVEGVTVYRFEQSIPETVIDEREVPAALAGGSGSGNVTAEVVFSNDRTLLVEPTSGKIVKVTENPVTVLRGPNGSTGVTILSAQFSPEDAAVRDSAAEAADTRDQITLISTVLPWALAALGVVLALVGLLLVLTGRRGAHSAPDADVPEYAVPARS